MDNPLLVNTASFEHLEVIAYMSASVGATIDFTPATLVTGSFSGDASNLTHVSASYIIADTNTTSSWANTSSFATTASSIQPGATFFQVSGSTGVPASYIEPYNYSKDNVFRPPSKEGRTFWDHKWVNWKVWQDTDYSGSSAAALNINLGRELNFAVHNPTNETLTRGTPVYISGSQTSSIYPFNEIWPQVYKPDVYKAIADGTGTKKDVVGLVRNAIPAYHDGYVCIRGTMHNTDVTAYGEILGTELWLSPTTAGTLTTTKPGQPYEVVKIGYLIETGSQGSILIQTAEEPPPANAYAGMTSIPVITDLTASQEVGIGSGSVNLYNKTFGAGVITQYPVPEITFSVPAGYDAYFVYATTDNVTASYEITTDINEINGTNKILVTTLYRADEDAHWMESKNEGLALANKLNARLLETEKFKWESGFSLLSTGSNYITITAGNIWFGATNIAQQEFNSFDTASTNPKYETHWAYHSASSWVIPIQTDGKWNSFYYDDGTDTASLAQDSWSLHYIYRILGENPFDEDIFIVTSNNQYDSFVSAQADLVPTNIPAVLDDVSLLVGRLIFQSGSTTGSAESAFTTNFGQSSISQHNSLAGIQGGLGGQYYHLTSQEYSDFENATGTGVYVRQNGASITGSLLGNVSTSSFVTLAQTSSYVILTQTASYVTFAQTASNVELAQSSSYVATASFVVLAQTASSVRSSSYSNTSSYASNSGTASFVTFTYQTPLTTGSTIPITSSHAVTASWAPATPSDVATSASWASSSYTSSFLTRNRTYEVTASWAVNSTSASWAPAVPSSTAISASWASSSYSASWSPATAGLGVNLLLSSSTYVTTIVNGTIISSSTGETFHFDAAPHETWLFDCYLSCTQTGAGGMKFALSASVTSSVKILEVWVEGPTNSVAALTRQRLNAFNTLQTTAVINSSGLTGPVRIKGSFVNGASQNIISLAVAVVTGGQTATINRGSYFRVIPMTSQNI